ncbi:SPOR domain-containing protein [Pedobacter agri]|uniref:HU domain-containing protein n=1 Tax=Pedobacter agri TaxID=454586 RepID=UPI0029316F7B|nr:SPOR domain-containing protein [Pedobacter agri]
MNILSYLLELLQQRKEVGISGLGTFYKKKSPGRYDKEKQSFLPPSYTLNFSSDVKPDQSLADYISAQRNISVESADYYISQFVDEVKQKLEEEHEADLENLGRLFFTEHEGLSFEAAKNINYGSEFYGLPPLAEASVEESEPAPKNDDDEIYEEIAEAPSVPTEPKATAHIHPIIENIELDEVNDDLKNTLKHTEKPAEEHDVPEFIKEQHATHPNRFGHTPEDEEAVKALQNEHVPVPEALVEQHEENPERFGHTPESEVPKTYINLEEETPKEETVIEAPTFIKEQHAEHPNRFGHDPIINQTDQVEEKSLWPKILIAIFALLLIGVIIYFIKPDLFSRQTATTPSVPVPVVDSPKNEIDTTKIKQDSIAKTDSILKANQVGVMKTDTAKAKTSVNTKQTPVVSPEKTMFHVIAVSYETEAAAQRYIAKVKKIGLNATIAKMEGKRKKVSIASFPTKDEATKQKDILQKRLKGEGFYVKEIKNNTQP